MNIGIIGAGISGLSTALALARRGHHVEIFQRESALGGLIATFDFDGLPIEHFYHFLCRGDDGYAALCRELGLADRIRFTRAGTGFYYDGRRYPFSSPLDLLRFTPIPFSQRLRFGLFALEARMREEWAQLDEITAKPWLIDRLGRRAYDVIWDPLLALKFGPYYDRISAAWVWHRLHRVARSKGKMGYLEGGTALLLDTLEQALQAEGAVIHRGRPVSGILAEDGRVQGVQLEDGGEVPCERVVSTVPLSVLADLLPAGWEEYGAQLRRIQYIGVVCLALKLSRPVSPYFWLNVHDGRAPFNGIIEYTNLNPLGGKAGHIVYVPYYVATDHPIYRMDDESVFRSSWEALKTITPGLRDEHLLARHVARAPYAQAICTTNFLKVLPGQRAPLQGLRLLDSVFLYPEDRTQSGQIVKAFECARDIEV